MRKRIYIAGPISIGDLRANIQQATRVATTLMRLGFAPMTPQLTAYMGGDTPEILPCGTTHEDWMGVDLPFVAVCDAVLRLPGESRGADTETEFAESRGIPVFHSIEELLDGLLVSIA